MKIFKIDNSFNKPYFCPLCMTLFLEKKNYSFNEKWKIFECKFCKKEFTEKDYSNEIRRKGKNYKVANKEETSLFWGIPFELFFAKVFRTFTISIEAFRSLEVPQGLGHAI